MSIDIMPSLLRMNLRSIGALMFILPALTAYAAMDNPRQPLPIAELVDLSRSTGSADQVIGRLKSSRTTYALRGSDFAKLKAAGVSDVVLDYLQQSLIDDLDFETRRWVGGSSLGGCGFCYPQPVDLSTMRSGYVALAATPPTRYVSGKPPGTPDWVPYPLTTSSGTKRLSVNDIADMANHGMSQEELIRQIKTGRLEHLTAAGIPSAIHVHPITGLGGAELARLSDQGVPAPALDALQAQFLAAFIEAQRLHYLTWGKGSKR